MTRTNADRQRDFQARRREREKRMRAALEQVRVVLGSRDSPLAMQVKEIVEEGLRK